MATQDTAVNIDTFISEWLDWHALQEARLADGHGFLAITSLHWLSAEPERFADAPGRWTTGPEGVSVQLDEGEELLVDGVAVAGGHSFGVIAERGSLYPASGDAVIEVAKRGGHDILRPRHPENPLRLGYAGTPAYAPDPRWAVPGATCRSTAASDHRRRGGRGLQHVYDAPGRVEFELDGRTLAPDRVQRPRPGSLRPVHRRDLRRDHVRGQPLAAGRPRPPRTARWSLDFNRAANLPCAYTDLATCPLPPGREPAPGRRRGRREDPLRARQRRPVSRNAPPQPSERGVGRLRRDAA